MNATEIPPLVLDGLHVDSCDMPVIIIWGNRETSRFFTPAAANAACIAALYLKQDSRMHGARIFEWDGTAWKQMSV